jgi:uncharacterized protein YyaL (SSP411 family)
MKNKNTNLLPVLRGKPVKIGLALVLILTISSLALFALAPGSGQSPKQKETATNMSTATPVAAKLTDYQKAQQTYEAVMRAFYVPANNLYREHIEPKPDDKAFSYLWPYSGMISALNALAKVPGDRQAEYKAALVKVLDGLEQYYDPSAVVPAYDSYVRQFGGGQKFYDDNQWLGLDFLEAYATLKDPRYLEKARITFRHTISGWSNDMGGGVYWRENDPDTKNTCSNGPAAVLALKLYEVTGEKEYLDWALKILDWVKQLKSPDSGVYWDNLTKEGNVDKRTYTYNTGTPLHAYALLYKITKDEKYLTEARALAASSVEHFVRPNAVANGNFYPDTPWFNTILFKGYLALYENDPARDKRYIETMRQNLNWAWENARTDKGLFSPDWSGASGVSNPHKWLLDQAPMVELYALLTTVK